jgi:hypothetical protein
MGTKRKQKRHLAPPLQPLITAWDTACWKAGLGTKNPETGKVVTTERIPHDFRRTAVRNLTRAGVSENRAMMLTGHRTRAVFKRYDIINEQDLIESVEELAASSTVTKRLQPRPSRRLRAVAWSGKQLKWNAGGGDRTRTAVTRQGILSPLCLPIPPPRRIGNSTTWRCPH